MTENSETEGKSKGAHSGSALSPEPEPPDSPALVACSPREAQPQRSFCFFKAIT